MRYVIETYWGWLAVALLVGNLVGYCLSWRRTSVGSVGSWAFMAAIAFVVGVFAAVLHWLPGRAGLYLETLLHLTFWYVIGGILGGWLRAVMMPSENVVAVSATSAAIANTPSFTAPVVEAPVKMPKKAARVLSAASANTAPSNTAPSNTAPSKDVPSKASPSKALQSKAAPSMAASAHEGAKPKVAKAPSNPDDLKRIRGIGNQNEGRLHGLGIWHFSQIAAWTPDNVKWVSSYLAFSGRIEREKWVDQASELAAGRQTAFSSRVAAGDVPTSKDDGSLGQKNVQIVKAAK